MSNQLNSAVGKEPRMDREELVTRKELAERLKCSKSTIDRWRRSGQIPWVRVGKGGVRFDVNEVLGKGEKRLRSVTVEEVISERIERLLAAWKEVQELSRTLPAFSVGLVDAQCPRCNGPLKFVVSGDGGVEGSRDCGCESLMPSN